MFIRNALFLMSFMSGLTLLPAEEFQQVSYITELNDSQFESFIEKADKPVIVDFWAPWCSPCMSMKPIFEQVADELKEEYLFVTMNFDEGRQTAQKYEVTTIPTFKVIKNNAVIGTIIGSTGKDSLIEQIRNSVEDKLTQDTLVSAINTHDKELVKRCLAYKGIDVNGITQIEVMGMKASMTPLITAVSAVIFRGSSLEIVSMLVEAGAIIDLAVDMGGERISSLQMIEQINQINIEENLSKRTEEERAIMDDEMLRQTWLGFKARAASVLELFQSFSAE